VKRLLLDQGLPRSAAALLTRAGWDVIHVSDIGMSQADDVDILRRGRAEGRICVTLDADFHSLLATSGACTPSVIRIRKEGLDAAALAALLQSIWPGIADALAKGAMSPSPTARFVFGSFRPSEVEGGFVR
jgi:predicted nuclease of predicted toxin-antitoxin system